MELGTVISNNEGLFVITNIENGNISETQRLQDYICRNVFIKHQGEYKRISEIIGTHIDEYLSSHTIIEEGE